MDLDVRERLAEALIGELIDVSTEAARSTAAGGFSCDIVAHAEAIIDRLGITELGYARVFSIVAAHECVNCGASALVCESDGEYRCGAHAKDPE